MAIWESRSIFWEIFFNSAFAGAIFVFMNFQRVVLILSFGLFSCASQPRGAASPDPREEVPELGVARLIKEDKKSFFVEVFFPAEFLETAPAEIWIQSVNGALEKTVPFSRRLEFFDEKGAIWESFSVPFATQKIWCENDSGAYVGTFVRIAVPRAKFARMPKKDKRLDRIVSFVRARAAYAADPDAAPKVEAPFAYRNIKLAEAPSDAGCGEGLSESALLIETPYGSADLRCCGP